MDPKALSEKIIHHVDSIIIDRMNYTSKTLDVYRRMNLTQWLDRNFVDDIIRRLEKEFAGKPVSVC